eukprot:11063071-Prorocentrum_lima.AAC.1
MTSSLVGSEMCIRDRLWPVRDWVAVHCVHGRSDNVDVRFFIFVMAKVAVSYTHLTLPTICSV